MESTTKNLDKRNLPQLVRLLVEIGEREELLIQELVQAVATGDRELVFEVAGRIAARRKH